MEQARISELDQIKNDLSWTDLDLEPTTRRLANLADALERVDTPEQQTRRDTYKLAREQVGKAEGTTVVILANGETGDVSADAFAVADEVLGGAMDHDAPHADETFDGVA